MIARGLNVHRSLRVRLRHEKQGQASRMEAFNNGKGAIPHVLSQ